MSGFGSKPPVEGIITWVYAENLAESEAFYGQTLGLPEIYRTDGARIYAASAGAHIGVCQTFADRVVQPEGGMITLLSHEVDAWHERLVQADAEIIHPPERHEKFAIYAFVAKDPNGYRIEFQQFLDAAWPG